MWASVPGDGEQPVRDERVLASAQGQVVEICRLDGITHELEGQRADQNLPGLCGGPLQPSRGVDGVARETH